MFRVLRTMAEGLTDGWHESLDRFEEVNNNYDKSFSQEQNNLAKTLIQSLKISYVTDKTAAYLG